MPTVTASASKGQLTVVIVVLAPVIVGAAEARLAKHARPAAANREKNCLFITYSPLDQISAAEKVVIMFLASALAVVSLALARYSLNCGMAMAAKIPIIATTIISSIRVKPFCFFILCAPELVRSRDPLNTQQIMCQQPKAA